MGGWNSFVLLQSCTRYTILRTTKYGTKYFEYIVFSRRRALRNTHHGLVHVRLLVFTGIIYSLRGGYLPLIYHVAYTGGSSRSWYTASSKYHHGTRTCDPVIYIQFLKPYDLVPGPSSYVKRVVCDMFFEFWTWDQPTQKTRLLGCKG